MKIEPSSVVELRRASSKLRRVLCAIDVERSATTSLSMASLLGERFHASVDALYATPITPAFDGRAARVQRLIGEHDAQERLTTLLASVKRKVCISSFVTRGEAAEVILSHSRRQSSDLIVMASSPRRRFVAGPHTIAPVAAQAECAVLTVGERFTPSSLRRILLPVGPAGTERAALSWASSLASRFDAEVGVLRVGPARGSLWSVSSGAAENTADALQARARSNEVIDALCTLGIDAYEIAHPGGGDADAVGQLCESGGFDAVVLGLPAFGEVRGSDSWLASVRLKTGASVLSVRTPREPARVSVGHIALPTPIVVGADWAQP